MSNINKTIQGLDLAQVCWVVPDINITLKFLGNALGISFPPPQHVQARDMDMTYYGNVVSADWLTTQAYNGGSFIELVQPLTGKSMFHDYLAQSPAGGIQHMAFRLPVEGFEQVTSGLLQQGYDIISRVDHPIAKMAFFDTYKEIGIVTEIMGITSLGWDAIKQMEGHG